jgi:methylated-DNA-[protein]-cysteine S-methyltransferase
MLAATDRGLVQVAFEGEENRDAMLERLAWMISPRVVEEPRRLDDTRRELDQYFEGRRRDFDLELDWSLVSTPFARRILENTSAIPFGSTSSYGVLAGLSGSPRAARAAGNALGANPIAIVVPCHRVLHTGGGIGGYGGGLDRKRTLLTLEGVLPATATR